MAKQRTERINAAFKKGRKTFLIQNIGQKDTAALQKALLAGLKTHLVSKNKQVINEHNLQKIKHRFETELLFVDAAGKMLAKRTLFIETPYAIQRTVKSGHFSGTEIDGDAIALRYSASFIKKLKLAFIDLNNTSITSTGTIAKVHAKITMRNP